MSQRATPERPAPRPEPGAEFRLSEWADYLHARYPGKIVAIVDSDPEQVFAFDTPDEARDAIDARGIDRQRVDCVRVPPADRDWPPVRRTVAPAQFW